MAESWAREVLDFWFALSHDDWWKGSPELDERIRERFAIEWARQSRRPIEVFLGSPEEALAAVILFDQLPRNMFRGHADQYMSDTLALAVAKGAIVRGFDHQLSKDEKTFLYMPFQHSEVLADQQRALALFTSLHDDWLLGYAKKHLAIIERFGRFPHRNTMLGRQPRPDEVAAGDVKPW